ncbi:MAG: M56 family metallopeptidase, partial [Eubacteriales bacterium]|nr:M56 family metallopeptidase [Eubacteriales bacterium]
MTELFLKIINMSISASWVVLAVLVLRFILKKAPKWVNVLLWGVVAIRLLCPFSIESALSLIPN